MSGRMSQGVVLNKNEVATEVVLVNGRTLQGVFFLAQVSQRHGGPETLLDLMNDAERPFIPFKMPEGVRLLNKHSVRELHFDSDELRVFFDDSSNDFMANVRILVRTESGESAQPGKLYLGDLHPSNRRPVDLLNTRDTFLLVYSDSKLVIYNKEYIVHVDVQPNPVSA